MKSSFWRAVTGLLILSCLVPLAGAAGRVKDLPPRYRHWLAEEVNYIIDSNEKKQFLSLTSDAQRDAFIKSFWDIRNPDPGSSTNSYKEEFYQRLAYANEHFGSARFQDGWRTPRGRIYIILGPPKQITSYAAAQNVRPLEIWFYQSPTLALPPYFYIVFYKRSSGDPYYSLYSPLQDGPARLVSSLEALNDQKRSLEILRKSLGDEVARISVSLIPGDYVSLDDYHPDLTSDVLLSHIAGLPDNPITQAKLQSNRLREHVSMSLFLGDNRPRFSYAVFRDSQGRETLSYLLQLAQSDTKVVGTRADGSSYYDMTLRTEVLTAAGKPVYNQVDSLTGTLTDAEAQAEKGKRFAAEARLPLTPGQYTLVATLTNNIDQLATREQAIVKVPVVGSSLAISNLLAYMRPSAVPDPQGDLPFSISHYRFTALGAENIFLRHGEQLPLVFQLWLGQQKVADTASAKVHLRYVFGSVASLNQSPTVLDEDVDVSNSDAAGNLLTGRTLDTSTLEPGKYQVVVSARREGDSHTAYATLNLHIEPADKYADSWNVFGPQSGGEAIDDLKRGISAQALENSSGAAAAYKRSISEGPVDVRAVNRLADVLDRAGQSEELAALSQQPLMSQVAVSPRALLEIAGALNKTGNPAAAVRMLNAQIAVQPPSAELYATLADAYAATGNAAKAREIRALAENLK